METEVGGSSLKRAHEDGVEEQEEKRRKRKRVTFAEDAALAQVVGEAAGPPDDLKPFGCPALECIEMNLVQNKVELRNFLEGESLGFMPVYAHQVFEKEIILAMPGTEVYVRLAFGAASLTCLVRVHFTFVEPEDESDEDEDEEEQAEKAENGSAGAELALNEGTVSESEASLAGATGGCASESMDDTTVGAVDLGAKADVKEVEPQREDCEKQGHGSLRAEATARSASENGSQQAGSTTCGGGGSSDSNGGSSGDVKTCVAASVSGDDDAAAVTCNGRAASNGQDATSNSDGGSANSGSGSGSSSDVSSGGGVGSSSRTSAAPYHDGLSRRGEGGAESNLASDDSKTAAASTAAGEAAGSESAPFDRRKHPHDEVELHEMEELAKHAGGAAAAAALANGAAEEGEDAEMAGDGSEQEIVELFVSSQYQVPMCLINRVEGLQDYIHKSLFVCTPSEATAFNEATFAQFLDEREAKFVPPGRRVLEYSKQGDQFCVYRATGADEGAKVYHDRAQGLAYWFIETADKIDLIDDRWEVYYLYQAGGQAPPVLPAPAEEEEGVPLGKDAAATAARANLSSDGSGGGVSCAGDGAQAIVNEPAAEAALPPAEGAPAAAAAAAAAPPAAPAARGESGETSNALRFAGYITVMSFRNPMKGVGLRICQALLLPPYQRRGHGSQLLKHVYSVAAKRPDVFEVSVEDPAPGFTALRNLVDARHCRDLRAFPPEVLFPNPCRSLTKKEVEAVQQRAKITASQVEVAHELLRLSTLDASSEASVKAYRLMVKRRLFAQHREELPDDTEARKARLEELFADVDTQYRQLVPALLPPAAAAGVRT